VIAGFDAVAHHHVQISLQVMSSWEVQFTRKCRPGEVDLGLMSDEMSMASLEYSVFERMPGAAVVSHEHPFARRTSVKVKDPVDMPFIALNPEDSTLGRLDTQLRALDITLRLPDETPYSHTICERASRRGSRDRPPDCCA
jgi:hypothetical protein